MYIIIGDCMGLSKIKDKYHIICWHCLSCTEMSAVCKLYTLKWFKSIILWALSFDFFFQLICIQSIESTFLFLWRKLWNAFALSFEISRSFLGFLLSVTVDLSKYMDQLWSLNLSWAYRGYFVFQVEPETISGDFSGCKLFSSPDMFPQNVITHIMC